MTEQKACTLCGAVGHSAAQCNWNQGIALLSSAEADYLAAGDYAAAERIEAFLASQQEQRPEQAEGAQGEREAFEARFPNCCFKQDRDGKYFDPAIHSAWNAWQARAALAPELEQSHFAETLRRIDLVLAALRSHDFHGIINSTIGKDWREQVAAMRGELRELLNEGKKS